MIIYVYNPKDVTRKVLELSNAFSKVKGYTINMQKSVAYLYTNNKIAEREIKETIPFTITPKIIKYLAINLPKDTKTSTPKTIDVDERQEKMYRVLGLKNQYC